MANIFTVEAGTAVAIRDPRVLPITFYIQNWFGYPTRNSIITGFSISSRSNHQFMNTLRNFTYVYVFGERMGDIMITGQTFLGSCDFYNFSGISRTIEYYALNGLYRTGAPVGIAIGATVWWGLLTGIDIGVRNPESRLGTFTLKYKSIAP